MKKITLWSLTICFVLTAALVFAQQAPRETLGGSTETKSGIPGGVSAPQKSREEIRKEKATKKGKQQTKKETPEGKKKGPEMLPGGTETKSGIPGGVTAPKKSATGQ